MARVYVRDWLYTYGVKFSWGLRFFNFFGFFEIVFESPFFNHFSIYGDSGGISDGNFSR